MYSLMLFPKARRTGVSTTGNGSNETAQGIPPSHDQTEQMRKIQDLKNQLSKLEGAMNPREDGKKDDGDQAVKLRPGILTEDRSGLRYVKPSLIHAFIGHVSFLSFRYNNTILITV